jgi:5-methylcytosine-specific restriction endonuclease McrA
MSEGFYGCDWERVQQQRAYAQKRQQRLEVARTKGTHTKAEWTILADLFGQCVRCGALYSELIGAGPSKDHIVPLYQGGCDCIANLQPLCRGCNSTIAGQIPVDYRNLIRPGWVLEFLARIKSCG